MKTMTFQYRLNLLTPKRVVRVCKFRRDHMWERVRLQRRRRCGCRNRLRWSRDRLKRCCKHWSHHWKLCRYRERLSRLRKLRHCRKRLSRHRKQLRNRRRQNGWGTTIAGVEAIVTKIKESAELKNLAVEEEEVENYLRKPLTTQGSNKLYDTIKGFQNQKERKSLNSSLIFKLACQVNIVEDFLFSCICYFSLLS